MFVSHWGAQLCARFPKKQCPHQRPEAPTCKHICSIEAIALHARIAAFGVAGGANGAGGAFVPVSTLALGSNHCGGIHRSCARVIEAFVQRTLRIPSHESLCCVCRRARVTPPSLLLQHKSSVARNTVTTTLRARFAPPSAETSGWAGEANLAAILDFTASR